MEKTIKALNDSQENSFGICLLDVYEGVYLKKLMFYVD